MPNNDLTNIELYSNRLIQDCFLISTMINCKFSNCLIWHFFSISFHNKTHVKNTKSLYCEM